MAVNRYPAPCAVCGAIVPRRAGVLSPGDTPEPALRAVGGWRVTHLACTDGEPGVIVTVFNSGATVTRNRRGTCEDAPCCGCCGF